MICVTELFKTQNGIFKLHFTMNPKVELWACGFFRIDNTLPYSVSTRHIISQDKHSLMPLPQLSVTS